MTIIILCVLFIYMAACGFSEGCKNRSPKLPPISDGEYHEDRTIVTFAVFLLLLIASRGNWWFSINALIAGNALYNRYLVRMAQGSWTDINRNADGTPATFAIFGEQLPYPWGTTGKPELYFTLPVFTVAALLLCLIH